jgi:hypothetical protein
MYSSWLVAGHFFVGLAGERTLGPAPFRADFLVTAVLGSTWKTPAQIVLITYSTAGLHRR